jgi:hypothetical protein
VYVLDNHFQEIGSRVSKFQMNPNLLGPRGIVVLEPALKTNDFNSFLTGLTVPVYTYLCAPPRTEASCRDLIIVPAFARKMKDEKLVAFFTTSKSKLEAFGFVVMSYPEYGQRFLRAAIHDLPELAFELTVSSRIQSSPTCGFDARRLKVSKTSRVMRRNPRRSISDNTKVSTTMTAHSSKSPSRSTELEAQAGRDEDAKALPWDFYYCKGVHCRYVHTKDKDQRFKSYGPREATAIKSRLCLQQRLSIWQDLQFAHMLAELLCTAGVKEETWNK